MRQILAIFSALVLIAPQSLFADLPIAPGLDHHQPVVPVPVPASEVENFEVILGDLNGDWRVGLRDLLLARGIDLNEDGEVNRADLAFFSSFYGTDLSDAQAVNSNDNFRYEIIESDEGDTVILYERDGNTIKKRVLVTADQHVDVNPLVDVSPDGENVVYSYLATDGKFYTRVQRVNDAAKFFGTDFGYGLLDVGFSHYGEAVLTVKAFNTASTSEISLAVDLETLTYFDSHITEVDRDQKSPNGRYRIWDDLPPSGRLNLIDTVANYATHIDLDTEELPLVGFNNTNLGVYYVTGFDETPTVRYVPATSYVDGGIPSLAKQTITLPVQARDRDSIRFFFPGQPVVDLIDTQGNRRRFNLITHQELEIVPGSEVSFPHHFANPDPGHSAKFGGALLSVGDVILVGAPEQTKALPSGSVVNGLVYVIDANPASFNFGRTLAEIPNPRGITYANFGKTLVSAGSNIFISGAGPGGDGIIYQYDRDALLSGITEPIRTISSPVLAYDTNNAFGANAVVSSENIFVSEPGFDIVEFDDQNAQITYNTGAVHVYDHSGNFRGSISNPSPDAYDEFGANIAVLGLDLLVSVPTSSGPGEIYRFDGDPASETFLPLKNVIQPPPLLQGGELLTFGHTMTAVGAHIAVSCIVLENGDTPEKTFLLNGDVTNPDYGRIINIFEYDRLDNDDRIAREDTTLVFRDGYLFIGQVVAVPGNGGSTDGSLVHIFNADLQSADFGQERAIISNPTPGEVGQWWERFGSVLEVTDTGVFVGIPRDNANYLLNGYGTGSFSFYPFSYLFATVGASPALAEVAKPEKITPILKNALEARRPVLKKNREEQVFKVRRRAVRKKK